MNPVSLNSHTHACCGSPSLFPLFLALPGCWPPPLPTSGRSSPAEHPQPRPSAPTAPLAAGGPSPAPTGSVTKGFWVARRALLCTSTSEVTSQREFSIWMKTGASPRGSIPCAMTPLLGHGCPRAQQSSPGAPDPWAFCGVRRLERAPQVSQRAPGCRQSLAVDLRPWARRHRERASNGVFVLLPARCSRAVELSLPSGCCQAAPFRITHRERSPCQKNYDCIK